MKCSNVNCSSSMIKISEEYNTYECRSCGSLHTPTVAEQIAIAWKEGDTESRVGGCMVFVKEDVHELFLGGEMVGGYYHKNNTALFFKVNSRVKTTVIQQIKKYI